MKRRAFLSLFSKGAVGAAAVALLPEAVTQAALKSPHYESTSNPHSVTGEQVGLGKVPDFAYATRAEAMPGTANEAYMTPRRLRQALMSRDEILEKPEFFPSINKMGSSDV